MVTGSAHAQLWSGVINSTRAVDWTNVGIPGGLPDASWTQCGSTISAYTGSGATIQSQLATCSANQYVLLGPGTFTLSSGILFPVNTTGHLVLRGSGSNSTILIFSGGASGCNGQSGFICAQSSDGTFRGSGGTPNVANWTSGYAQGATQIILSSVSGIIAGKTELILNQCDTGWTGSTCTTGSSVDNNGYFECATPWASAGLGCNSANESADGQSWRGSTLAYAWQQEEVLVTAINASGCGATCVTISHPLHHPNWSSGQSPIAIIIQPLPQVGVENLSIDGTSAQSVGDGVYFFNTFQSWVSGVRVVNAMAHAVSAGTGVNDLFQNNYVFGNPSSYGDNTGFSENSGGNNLVQNNICQQVHICWLNDGPSEGDVFAYNFSVNQYNGTNSNDNMIAATVAHSAGDNFQLFEGNAINSMLDDNDHGTHLNQTRLRNFIWGWESCANGQCQTNTAKAGQASAMISVFGARYGADVGNVLGTNGWSSVYQSATFFSGGDVFQLGAGNANAPAQPTDTLVASTRLRWGNYDTVTNAVRWCGNSSDTGWSTTCSSTSEVPTGAPTYPNSVPTLGDTGAGQSALPTSFYLSSKPAWFGSIPWPAIGPDVSGGNIGQCTGTLNTSGHQSGLPATNGTQCIGTSLTTGWAGHVNAIPAQACYFSMGLPPDGTGSVGSFNATSCYSSSPGSPSVSFSPSSYTWPTPVTVGTGSSTQTIVLSNVGTGTLNISLPITVTGPNALEFSIISNQCASTFGGIIVAGGSCNLVLQFSPSAIGLRSATITMNDNASGSPHTVPLSGTGTGPPVISLPPPASPVLIGVAAF